MTEFDVSALSGATVVDTGGNKIGKVGQVYLDDQTGQPEWVTVKTGLFGTKESFVPLALARHDGDHLTVVRDQGPGHRRAAGRRGRAHLAAGGRRDLPLLRGVRGGRRPDRHVRVRRERHRGLRHHGDRGSGDHRRSRHLRSGHGRGDDPLRGAPGRRHPADRGRPGPAAQARGDRDPAGPGAGLARGGPAGTGADHRRQPGRRVLRRGHHRGGARGHPAGRAPGRDHRGPAGRTGPARQGDRHRPGDRLRRGPQGADRVRRRHRHGAGPARAERRGRQTGSGVIRADRVAPQPVWGQSASCRRSCCRVRASSRDTCIWEMPSWAAIWDWVWLP